MEFHFVHVPKQTHRWVNNYASPTLRDIKDEERSMKSKLAAAALATMLVCSGNSSAQSRIIEAVDNGNVSIEVLSVAGESTTVVFAPLSASLLGLDIEIFNSEGDVVFTRLGVIAATPINNVTLVTGRSNDNIRVGGAGTGPFTGDLVIDTRNGDDVILVDEVDVGGQINVRGRAGNDEIEIKSSDAARVYAGLGPGSGEELRVIDSRFSGRASFSGGRGTDTLTRLGSNVFEDRLVIRQFEFETEEIVEVLLGDVDLSGVVDSEDIAAFNAVLSSGGFQAEADCDENGVVDVTDIDACNFPYAIGVTGPGGGIVFSVSADGTSGLEAAPEDQSTGVQWCDNFTDIPGVENLDSDFSISDPNLGAENTPRIIDECGDSSAAGVAAAYEWPNGQTDGFLPNREELDLLFNQRTVVGGFAGGLYWSSSEFDNFPLEFDNFNAWGQVLGTGIQLFADKQNPLRVRAVRAF